MAICELAWPGRSPRPERALKKLPGIADPGADRILLFAEITPIAAVPSNCVHVLVRVLYGKEHENYSVTSAIAVEIPETFDARSSAYLLLKHHCQEICRRTSPKCGKCPVSSNCAFFAGHRGPKPAG